MTIRGDGTGWNPIEGLETLALDGGMKHWRDQQEEVFPSYPRIGPKSAKPSA